MFLGWMMKSARVIAKNLLTLGALAVVFPANLLLSLGAVAVSTVGRISRSKTQFSNVTDAKTVLISGGKMTKALQLARSFAQAGHRVVLTESRKYWLIGNRFSSSVHRFRTLPEPTSPDYAKSLLSLVKQENIDVYIPVCSPISSLHDAQAIPLLAPYCEVVHVDAATIERLDDKFQFSQVAQSLGLKTPRSFLITDPEQVVNFDFSQERRRYILKSIAYDSVRRLNLTKLPAKNPTETAAFARSLPISEVNPWIMQEFIPGKEYCTHGTFRNGELRVYCCCESSAFQVNYQHIEKPEIEQWVTTLAAGLQLTGQASFDFIEAEDDGQIYAIECNPRTHSAITMLYNHPGVAQAYLGDTLLQTPVRPLASSRPTYWIYHELWRLLTQLGSPSATRNRLRTIFQGHDAVFSGCDPLPFLMLHHWQIPLLLLRDLRACRGWIKIDFNIGKLVQLGGD